MRIHFFQHVPFEGLGSIGGWINTRGYNLTATALYHNEAPPQVEAIDWLIVLGGPMGVYDEAKFPWLTSEKRFIEKSIKNGKVVLGVCLGAQLIADVLGARVYANRFREIGWYPIELTEAGKSSPLFGFMPGSMEVFHWHGDTFDLPPGAIHIAQSEACAHQAFVYGEKAVGLQFHLESAREGVEALIRNCADELTDGKYIQMSSRLLAHPQSFAAINRAMDGLLERIELADKR